MASLEERLQRLEDIEAIKILLLEYARLLDARDLIGYSKLFARDAEWTGPYIGSARGPDAILALMQENLRPAPKGSHHLISNMIVDVNGDSATAWCRWRYLVPDEDGAPRLAVSGRYEDEVVRDEGVWRFRSRTVYGDLSGQK